MFEAASVRDCILKCRRLQRHNAVGAGFDTGLAQCRFRHDFFHIEPAGDELVAQIIVLRTATCSKGIIGSLGHFRPHIAQNNQTEEMHIVR